MIKIIITLLTCINFTTVMASTKLEEYPPSQQIWLKTKAIHQKFSITQEKGDLENIQDLTINDITLSRVEGTTLETHQYLLQLTQKHPLEQTLKCLSKNPLEAYYIVETLGQSYLNNVEELGKIVKIYPRPNIGNSEKIKEKILAVLMSIINLNKATCSYEKFSKNLKLSPRS